MQQQYTIKSRAKHFLKFPPALIYIIKVSKIILFQNLLIKHFGETAIVFVCVEELDGGQRLTKGIFLPVLRLTDLHQCALLWMQLLGIGWNSGPLECAISTLPNSPVMKSLSF